MAHRQAFVDVLALCLRDVDTPAVLVNNAAITQAADLMTLGEDDFSRVLSTNVNSVFFGCQVFGAAMADRGYGRIVNMASLAGQNGGTATGATMPRRRSHPHRHKNLCPRTGGEGSDGECHRAGPT